MAYRKYLDEIDGASTKRQRGRGTPARQSRWCGDAADRLPGFVDAVVDPLVNAIALAARSVRSRETPSIHQARMTLTERALVDGPDTLTRAEQSGLLNDPVALARLHERVWTSLSGPPCLGVAVARR